MTFRGDGGLKSRAEAFIANATSPVTLPLVKELAALAFEPVPMLLFCPRCDLQHVDKPDPENGWVNPPHRSHLCANPDCGHIWRPSDRPTTGVAAIETHGEHDGSPSPVA